MSRNNRIALALAGAGGFLLVASCGSRTGLFGPDQGSDGIGPRGSASGEAGADAAPIQPVGCTPGKTTFELALTQLMFVIDRSRSMEFDLAGNQSVPDDQQRWRILQRALGRTITAYDQQISMGAKFFPDVRGGSAEGMCTTDTGVAIAPARGNAGSILGIFDSTEPNGGTPTSEAVRIAAEFLTTTRSIARTIVLATDGAPNCNFDDPFQTCVCTSRLNPGQSCGSSRCLDASRTIETISEVAIKQAIPVYVIGIGSTEQPEFLKVLDDMAVAGGRALPGGHHYNVQSESDLGTALSTIRDAAARCTYLTPSAPRDPDGITVSIDGTVVPRDPSKQDGWEWINLEFGELAFFGDACAKALANVSASPVSGVVRCD